MVWTSRSPFLIACGLYEGPFHGLGSTLMFKSGAVEYERGKWSSFSAILIGSEGVRLHLSRGLHHFVFYLEYMKESLVQKLTIEGIIISPVSVFIGRGYLQHPGAE